MDRLLYKVMVNKNAVTMRGLGEDETEYRNPTQSMRQDMRLEFRTSGNFAPFHPHSA